MNRAPARRSPALWILALTAAPGAWVLHLYLSYALVTVACRAERGWVLPVLWLVALVLAAAGGATTLRLRRSGGADGLEGFLSLAGLAASGFFLLLLLAAGLPSLRAAGCG